MRVRSARTAAVAAIVALLLSGCALNLERRIGGELIDEETDAQFYELPATLPVGSPGEIIRVRPVPGAPEGSRAWRVIYYSTDMAGASIPVSAIVVEPDGLAPSGGRPIVSWAHPTTGSAAKCAPSLSTDPFSLIEGLSVLLGAGYAVAATDYQGMGVAGASSYLLGVTEGNNVLDAVRAAQNIPGTDIGLDVLLWGHSQGGQAALFAAQQARQYAPELHLEAVAVAAPAANLSALMTDDLAGLPGVTIASLAIMSMEAAYADRFPAADLDAILTPAGASAAPKLAALCLLAQKDEVRAIADPLIGKFVTADPSTTEPWATILKENSAGALPIGVPIYVGQGLADELVIPTATAAYALALCSAGESVQFDEFNGVDHGLAATVATPFMLEFFTSVRAGKPQHNCP